jgi:hypothetical protein
MRGLSSFSRPAVNQLAGGRLNTGESIPGDRTLQQQMPNQSTRTPPGISEHARNSLLANDLQFMRINAGAAEPVRSQANFAVVTKRSAELSFLQP